MTEAAAKGPTRFSTMAHLFLSDIRTDNPEAPEAGQAGAPGIGKIKRIRPGERADFPPTPLKQTDPPETRQTDPSDFLLSQADPAGMEGMETEDPADEKLHIIGVYSSHLRWAGNKYLGQFARTLAGQGKMVAVLKLEAWSANLRLYYRRPNDPPLGGSGRSPSPLGPPMPEVEEYLEDTLDDAPLTDGAERPGGVWGHLKTLAETMDYFLISWGPEFGGYEDRLYRLLDEVCIVTSPERDKLVGSYQLLKSLKPRLTAVDAGVFVGDVGSFSEAQAVYAKLARTCRDFAGMQIENYGYALSEGAVVQELVARTELREQSQNWFDDLETWLKSQKEIDPGEPAAEPLAPEENLETPPVETEPSAAAAEIKETNPEPPAAPAVSGQEDDTFIMEDDPTEGRISEVIGNRIVSKGVLVGDSLMVFLQSIGVNASRYTDADGHGTVVLVLKNEEDSAAAIWAMEHYPVREDRLILVTDKQIGQVEKSVWLKYFGRLQIKRFFRGKLHGRQVLIIEK